jgi:hypothetical protein
MNRRSRLRRCLTAVGLGCLLLGLAGCKSPDTENQSARPWASPRSWEGGLPTSLMEGR